MIFYFLPIFRQSKRTHHYFNLIFFSFFIRLSHFQVKYKNMREWFQCMDGWYVSVYDYGWVCMMCISECMGVWVCVCVLCRSWAVAAATMKHNGLQLKKKNWKNENCIPNNHIRKYLTQSLYERERGTQEEEMSDIHKRKTVQHIKCIYRKYASIRTYML